MEGIVISDILDFFDIGEKSQGVYSYPFPKGTHIKSIMKHPPEKTHRGPFRGAIDFIVDVNTEVSASKEGVVTKVVDTNDKFGNSAEFSEYLNYITILHEDGESSQYAHLKKGSSLVKEGDRVTEGQEIAATGNSGWMSEPHLHFIVFKSSDNESGFQGLKPRFKEEG